MPTTWTIPEGLRILEDGSWRVGDQPVRHGPSLQYLKSHLVFDDDGAFVVDGARRLPVSVEGPPFEVVRLILERALGEARVLLDDDTQEPVREGSLSMSEDTGRFQCVVRGGRSRAVLSRAAHQTLLENAEEDGGRFFLRVGDRRISIRT